MRRDLRRTAGRGDTPGVRRRLHLGPRTGLAIYGYALAAEYADLAAKLGDYDIQRAEPDHVARWDFDAPDDDRVHDTSTASITVCGLFQLASVLPAADERADQYRNAALATLGSLGKNYLTDPAESNGLLSDAAYNRNRGDYFYVEGLVRATEQWRRYW